jgi:hypothetical protein
MISPNETIRWAFHVRRAPSTDGSTGRASQYMTSFVRACAREPLVHFLLAGLVLLTLSAWLGRSTAFGGTQHHIQVTAAKVQQLRDTWTAQWGQPPNANQLQQLIDGYVREEVLFREAIASGLDRDDTIIRRHLAQKIEFLTQGVAAATTPTEAELTLYFEQHPTNYLVAPKVAFRHAYFSTSIRGAAAAADAATALARLHAGGLSAAAIPSLGDSFMLQSQYPLKTREEIRDLFGLHFADELFTSPVGEWTGPVASSYGVHLVRVEQRTEASVPKLDDVRDRVMNDYNDQRVRFSIDAYYSRLRARYSVDVDRGVVKP